MPGVSICITGVSGAKPVSWLQVLIFFANRPLIICVESQVRQALKDMMHRHVKLFIFPLLLKRGLRVKGCMSASGVLYLLGQQTRIVSIRMVELLHFAKQSLRGWLRL
jgi:hypothetical protein